MEPLSAAAQARIEAFRRAEGPDDAALERCLAALEREIASAEATPRPRRAPVMVLALAVVAVAAGIALVILRASTPGWQDPDRASAAPHAAGSTRPEGAALGPGSTIRAAERADAARESAPASPQVAPAPIEGETAAAMKVAPPTISDVDVDVDADEGAGSGARGTARPSSRAPRTPAPADDLAAEVAMLREAKLAAPAARLEILRAMARRFPNGALTAERGLLEIEARCALGEGELARSLVRRHPDPDLAARAAEHCPEGSTSP